MRARERSDEQRSDEQRTRKSGGIWLLAIVAAIPFYVLSLGPIEWLDRRGFLPQAAYGPVRAVYFPIIWVVENTESGHSAMKWYTSLWR